MKLLLKKINKYESIEKLAKNMNVDVDTLTATYECNNTLANAGNVLREDGTGKKNLYAAGEMSNRDFYNQYYILAASLAFYSTMGLRAGAAAAENAK